MSYTRTSIRVSPFRGSIYLLTYRRYRLLYRETVVNNLMFISINDLLCTYTRYRVIRHSFVWPYRTDYTFTRTFT
nr:MAG TPA: hypothetical protein [Caudoviricetes sp.]